MAQVIGTAIDHQDQSQEPSSDQDPSSKLQAELTKLRGHYNGTQRSVAKLLDAIESTLTESKTNLTPTAYYQALISTLTSISLNRQSQEQDHDEDHQVPQTEQDSLYLLAIVMQYLPKSIIQLDLNSILELIQPLLNQLVVQAIDPSKDHQHRQQPPQKQLQQQHNQPTLKSILSLLNPIYHSFSPNDLTSIKSQSIARPIFLKSILPLTLAQQPKTRKLAQNLISRTISHPPVPLRLHPYTYPTIQFILDQLQAIVTTNYPNRPDRSITLIISLLHFIQSILPQFSEDRLDALISILLSLPKLNHPFLTETVFNTLENLFGPQTQLDPQTVLSILTKIINLEPTPHPACLSARLNALEHAWITLARVSPEACSRELSRIARLDNLFENLSNSHQNVRSSTMNLLSAICKYCLTDREIDLASQSPIESKQNLFNQPSSSIDLIRRLSYVGLESPEIISVGGSIELIGVLKSLIIRLRHRPRGDGWDSLPYAARLLKQHIIALDRLRSKPLGLQSPIDDVLACFSQVCGPGVLLEILPLNLDLGDKDRAPPHSSDRQGPGRAWLLTVIKVFNSSLGHFISYFVPLSELLFEKKRDTLKLSSNNKQTDNKLREKCLLQIKIYDTLIDQIWRLLPAYCDLPWDLEVAFNRSFAELLAQMVYSQPTLRPPILNSIKTLIDKTQSLAKRSTEHSINNHQNDSSINEFGFNAHSNLNHLQSFASNFLSVLFNVYNSAYSNANPKLDQSSQYQKSNANNANRGYMVECMRSLLEIISDEELSASYHKIKSVLDQSIQSAPNITTQKMLDLLIILLPRVISSSPTSTQTTNSSKQGRIKEIEDLVYQDCFISSGDPNIQKKTFKLLTTFIQAIHHHPLVLNNFDPNRLIQKLIDVQSVGKVSGQAKRERAILLSELVSIIPNDKLHYVPKLLTEVILGCKETNSEVRVLSYDGLIKIGHKIRDHGGKVDWKALMVDQDLDEENQMDDVEQEVSIEEYFKMISAGLAGSSPHMVSATIAALSRVLFEFHKELSRTTIEELISTIEIFLNSPNREIAKTAIGFMKVVVISLPKEVVIDQLDKIVPGLLRWANEHKNFFKSNIQNLLERLIRKFGSQSLESFVTDKDENDGGRKLVSSLIKKHRKKNSTNNRNDPIDAGDISDDEDDMGHRSNRVRLGDAYEEALYGSSGSGSEDEDGSDQGHINQSAHGRKGGQQGKKNQRTNTQSDNKNHLLEDDSEEVMDLLGGARMTNRQMAEQLAKVEKKKEELRRIGAEFKKDSGTGKMVIEEDSDEDLDVEEKRNREINRTTNAYLEAIHGEDGFRRDAKGNIKFNKKRKSGEVFDDQDHEDLDQDSIRQAVKGFHLDDDQDQNKKKKVKRVKERLGAEFKAKKAEGDRVISMKKDKEGKDRQASNLSPFAYLPLHDLNSKKNRNRVFKNLNITGKVKGSRS